jgi:hypothetical protein
MGPDESAVPKGPFSALTANGDLCKNAKTTTTNKRVAVKRHGHTVHVIRKVKHTTATPLLMPTTFVAQNGAQLHQSTKIAVTGCGKGVVKKAKKKSGKKKGK